MDTITKSTQAVKPVRGRTLLRCLLIPVLALSTILLLAGATFATSSATPPAPSRALWGIDDYSASNNTFTNAEQAMGRTFQSFADYEGLEDAAAWPGSSTISPEAHAAARGAVLYLNINSQYTDPCLGDPTQTCKYPICWTGTTGEGSIVNGNYNAYLDAWSMAIQRLLAQYSNYSASNIVITFSHEPNVDDQSNQPKCDGVTQQYNNGLGITPQNTYTGPSYISAFQYVENRLKADGMTAEKWAYVPSASAFRVGNPVTASIYDPCASTSPCPWYRVIGADVYNKVAWAQPCTGQEPGGYMTFDEAADALWSYRTANEPGMSIVIGELGDTSTDGCWATWITGAIGAMKSLGNLFFVNWNMKDPDFDPLQNPDAETAWLAGAADPFFQGIPVPITTPVLVQHSEKSNTASTSANAAALPGAIQSGDALVAAVGVGGTCAVNSMPAGWQQDQMSTGNAVWMFHLENATGSEAPPHFGLSGSCTWEVEYTEFSDVYNLGALDRKATNFGTGKTMDSGTTPTPNLLQEVSVAAFWASQSGDTMGSCGTTTDTWFAISPPFGTADTMRVCYKVLTQGAAQHVTMTLSPSDTWRADIVTYKTYQ